MPYQKQRKTNMKERKREKSSNTIFRYPYIYSPDQQWVECYICIYIYSVRWCQATYTKS